jgi:hypothetical protein
LGSANTAKGIAKTNIATVVMASTAFFILEILPS